MAGNDDLSQELAFFESIREQLVAHNLNQYAVIKDEELLGTYSDFDSAFVAGVDAFGTDLFLVKRIQVVDVAQSNPALVLGLMGAHASS